MNPEVLPQKQLDLMADLVRLAPPETSTKEHITRTLDYLEAKQKVWAAEQDRRLRKAERRIKLCAYLHGMLLASGIPLEYSTRPKHFSWCPFEDWMGNGFFTLDDLFGSEHGHSH